MDLYITKCVSSLFLHIYVVYSFGANIWASLSLSPRVAKTYGPALYVIEVGFLHGFSYKSFQ